MNTFTFALIPILTLIALGYVMKRWSFLGEEVWTGIERLTYFVLFPALLVRELGGQSVGEAPWPAMLGVVAGTLFVAAGTLVVLQLVAGGRGGLGSGATFTSIFQGGVRYNTYIVLAVAQGLYGAEGLAMGSLAAGFMIVQVNLYCISAFAVWGRAGARGVGPFMREVVRNPLILGCAAGWALSLSGLGMPALAGDILDILGRASLPLGLLAVGAAQRPRAIPGHARAIMISSAVQFGLKPLVAGLLVAATGLGGAAAGAVLLGFITPTAPSGYILARQLAGDTETMASIITCQTLMAFALMPLLAAVLPL